MIEPVELHDFLLAFFASAGVILSGACYALLFAWSRLGGGRVFLGWAYVSYAVLAVSIWILAETAHLQGYWQVLVAAMLVGYFVLPRVMFWLCSATHSAEKAESSTWSGYFAAQTQPWFVQSMVWRLVFGVMTLAGAVLLVWDLLTIGKYETRAALVLAGRPDEEEGQSATVTVG